MLKSTRLFVSVLAFAAAIALPGITFADSDHVAKMEAAFKAADKNGDGKLDKEEAKAMPRVSKNFDAIDADKDGSVTMAEIQAYMKAQHKSAQQ
jgi:Ca2+-binding EF-hand superfamily protein